MSTTDVPPQGDIAFVGDQIAEQQERKSDEQRPSPKRRRRLESLRPILWRLHFIGGFLVAPLVLSMAITGIVYAWHPQVDQLRFGSIMTPSSKEVSVPLSDQVAAAQRARPEWPVYSVTPGHVLSGEPDLNTAVLMDPPGGEDGFSEPEDGVFIFVDQATGKATGEIKREDLTDRVTRELHSSWRLGDDVEPLSELAGSWFIVTLFIGVYLWWPGLRRRGAAAFAFRRGMKGRRQSKDWHNFLGLALIVPMVFLVITGLTWTEYAGERYDGLKTSLTVPERMEVDSSLPLGTPDGRDVKNIDMVYTRAQEAGLVNPVRITPPGDGQSAWTAQSNDALFPVERDAIAVDGASGDVTARFDYSDENWFNKLATAGILFHQAQLFGVPLQIFMTVLAVGIIAMVMFGYRMWWQRRPQGGMGAPPPLRDWIRNAPISLMLLVLVLAWLLPTLGLALIVWLVLERGFSWLQLARGRPVRTQRSRTPAKHRPGVEAYKAAGIAVLGLAMVLVPGLGENTELETIPRLLAWAWSVPLGVTFLAVGLTGLYAMFKTHGRPVRAA